MKREADDQSKAIERKVVDLSRRCFSGRVIKMVGMGIFSHFSLLGSNLWAQGAQSGDDCPGGGDADDYCMPGADPDNCPGEMPPEDVCPDPGPRSEDLCESGLKIADTCIETPDPNADQCQSGNTIDDECAGNTKAAGDQCPTGQNDTDACPPNGTDAMGDQCPGGDPTNGLDTCEPEGSGPSGGDECSEGSFGKEDDCNAAHTDVCNLLDDDSCPDGTNAPLGSNGGSDWCRGDILASDECPDGTDSQDLCISRGKYGAFDSCPDGSKSQDHCTSSSDDVCVKATVDSDECHPELGDEDECPGGQPPEDQCPTGDPPEDECTSAQGCAGGDQETGYRDPDECEIVPLDTCTLLNPDGVE